MSTLSRLVGMASKALDKKSGHSAAQGSSDWGGMVRSAADALTGESRAGTGSQPGVTPPPAAGVSGIGPRPGLTPNGFKAVNDLLGHAAGDALLREVGHRLRSVIRETDVLGRFGGDESIAVAAVESVGDARMLADRIRLAVAEPYADLPGGLPITASVGVVTVGNDGAPVMDQLIRAADNAMYQAKMAGGDRVTHTDL